MGGEPVPVQVRNLASLYDLGPLDWSAVTDVLDGGVPQAPGTGGPNRHTCWLATIGPDGAPHVTGIGAMWVDGAFFFETGPRSRKARNLARDPRCTLSVALSSYDLVVEGVCGQVENPVVVAALAERWSSEGWPATVDSSGIALTAPYSAPSAGPPPWFVYRLDVRRATALGIDEPGGATSWTFAS